MAIDGRTDSKGSSYVISEDSYLRWAALKALVLLRLHRDLLDELAAAMEHGLSVGSCIQLIEDSNTASSNIIDLS